MSGGTTCKCEQSKLPIGERRWVVNCRNGNRSAFNGYRFERSNYSSVTCLDCRATWRTTAFYVFHLKDRVSWD